MDNTALITGIARLVDELERLYIGEKHYGPIKIPLKKKIYDRYQIDSRGCEYRLYGDRWNETTCYTGRTVILKSGAEHSIMGEITSFRIIELDSCDNPDDFINVHGNQYPPDTLIVEIKIEVLKN